jgi:hypothetical protein
MLLKEEEKKERKREEKKKSFDFDDFFISITLYTMMIHTKFYNICNIY